MAPAPNRLTATHLWVFVGLLVAFTVVTFLATDAGVDDGPKHDLRVIKTTAATITGPLTGAISRDFQSCCRSFSLFVMAWCAPVLALGFAAQFVRLPDRTWIRRLRMSLWVVGWLTWFMGGLLSFAHALS